MSKAEDRAHPLACVAVTLALALLCWWAVIEVGRLVYFVVAVKGGG